MNGYVFASSIVIGIATPIVAVSYLRPILVRVLIRLCDADGGVEFWIRSAYLLAVCGTLTLLLAFGRFETEVDMGDSLRRTLELTMIGVFVTIAFIACGVWSQVRVDPPGRRGGREPTRTRVDTVEGRQ